MSFKGYEELLIEDFQNLMLENGGHLNLSTLLYDLAKIRKEREQEEHEEEKERMLEDEF